MSATETITNLAHHLSTTTGITRVAAAFVGIPAILITPWLLICEHPLTDCAAIANLASVGMALKTGEPLCLIPALGITGGLIGYNIYRAMTYDSINTGTNQNMNGKKTKTKKPTQIALQVETYVQPH